ncbi:MAG: zinc ribbon domain-containing protein [Acidimicrobiales bacterium]
MFGRTRSTTRRAPAAGRHYLLAGMMRCGLCGRRMQGQWNHGRPYYRCKFADDYGIDPNQHPKSVYVKEDAVVPGLDGWLAGLFDAEHLDGTCEVLAGAAAPDPDYEARQADLESKIRDCDRRLARYREALEHVEGEVVPIAGWITEVQRERKSLEGLLGRNVPGGTLTKPQVKALVGALRDKLASWPMPTRPTRRNSTANSA